MGGAAKMRKGRKQVGDMNNVSNDLVGSNHTRPTYKEWNSNGAFCKVTFTASVKCFNHAIRPMMRHGAIVCHKNDKCIFFNACILECLQ